MESSTLMQSFLNPFSPTVERFDFIINHYFTTQATFNQFDPFDNGYIMGFMLAILCSIANSRPANSPFSRRHLGVDVEDILISVLGINDGFKSLTITKERMSGMKVVLIQNFFFKRKLSELHDRGLSKKERENVIPGLIKGNFEQKIVEYLLYNINSNAKKDKKCDHRIPYMQRIINTNESNENAKGYVRSFHSLRGILKLPFNEMANVINVTGSVIDGKIVKMILQNIMYQQDWLRMIANSSHNSNVIHGFIHGVLFATSSIHKLNVRLEALGNTDPAISLVFQTKISLGNKFPHIIQPLTFDLTEQSTLVKKPDKRIMKTILSMVMERELDTNTLELIFEYVADQVKLITSFETKYTGNRPHYISIYLLGMILANRDPYLYNVYRLKTGQNSQVVVQIVSNVLIIFNFDQNTQISFDGLKINQFEEEIRNRGVIVISILEKETECNGNLFKNFFSYDFNVTILNSKTYNKSPDKVAHYYHSPTTNFTELLLLLNEFDKTYWRKVFTEFTQIMLEIRHQAKRDPSAFAYFVQGLLHDTTSLETGDIKKKVDKFHSDIGFSLRSESPRAVTQVNFMQTKFNLLYTNSMKSMSDIFSTYVHDYRIVNIFYGINETTGNLSFHIRLGVTLDPDNFTYSDCFTWNKTLVDCPKPVHTPRSLATSKVLPTSYETYFTIVEKFKQINEAKMHSSDPLHIERNGHLQMSNFFQRYTLQVDTLKNPYYSTSDLIWMGILVHDTSLANYKQLNSILKWKSSSMVKSGSSSTLKQKLSPFKAADGFLVPLLGAGLAIYDIRAAVQNYQNGDHSSMAVYNIASSFVFLATSLMSLGASIVMLANGLSAVSPIFSAAVFIVGTAFYIIGHVWKGRLEIERISDRISMSEWEKVRQYTRIILGRGIYNEFIQASNDKEWNKQRLKDDIKYMEKNTGIRNFVTSAGCYDVDQTEFGPCKNIKIDLREKSELDGRYLARSDPNINANYTHKYEKICHATGSPIREFADMSIQEFIRKIMEKYGYSRAPTGYKPGKSPLTRGIEGTDGTNFMPTYFCTDAFGIRRLGGTNPNDVTEYRLHGDSTVFASSDTINVFRLSGGHHCEIFGGQKQNVFIFASLFRFCHLEGSELGMDILDLTLGIGGKQPLFIIGKGAMITAIRDMILSEMTIRHIDRIRIGTQVGNDRIQIFCNVKNIEVVENMEPYWGFPMRITLMSEDCHYDLAIALHGYVNVTSRARYGNVVYKFNRLNGNVSMRLLNSENMTHRLEMHLLNFTDIEKFVTVPLPELENMEDVKVKFYFNNTEISIHMNEGAESLELSFADGITIKFADGSFYTYRLFPESKARLMYDLSRIINLCDKFGIVFSAYSERDQEFFTLTNKTIQFDLLEMKLSIFETSDTENPPVKQIRCNPGYNIVLIRPTCCTNLTTIINDGAKVFQVVVLEFEPNMHELGLDLTLVTDAIDEWNTPYYLEIEPIVHHSSMVLLINMIVREEITPYRIGAIRLNDVISLENYKKVKVSAKSDFILEYNNTSMTPKVTPLPRVICPFSPIVVLNPFVVERGQTILFNDRIMTNYDPVELDNSTLLITNMASDMMQMFILKEEDVPLLTIIIEHYKSEQMKNTKLKFEHGIELDLNNLNGHEIINYFTFKLKIHVMCKHIGEEGLVLRQDLRFNSDGSMMSL